MLRTDDIMVMIVCSLATAAICWTISKGEIFEPLRRYLLERSLWWYGLFSCPYCLSHYVAALFSVVLVGYKPVYTGVVLIDWTIAVFATVTLSTAFGGYLIRYAMAYSLKEGEKIEAMSVALHKARLVIRELQEQEGEDEREDS